MGLFAEEKSLELKGQSFSCKQDCKLSKKTEKKWHLLAFLFILKGFPAILGPGTEGELLYAVEPNTHERPENLQEKKNTLKGKS